MQIKLPVVPGGRLSGQRKRKILLLSDDLRMNSGIATMSREFVLGTAHIFDWVQLGAALRHPDHGKVFDISAEVNSTVGITNASVKIYAHTGYGTQDVLREVLVNEKPDAILHFTDPRFWDWLYYMEYEIRSQIGIPLMYYNIWDAPPAPYWNAPFYKSCDLLMNISRQTHELVKIVLGEEEYTDIDDNTGTGSRLVSYVPHGINSKYFYPITEGLPEYNDYVEFVTKFKESHKVDFIFFWNNRNIRRKMMGDLVLAYRKFWESVPDDKKGSVALFMHTAMRDENGTDIPEVARVVCPDAKIIFNEEKLPTNILNMFYNMADVTINIASNEGFGLSSAESIMAGTPVINNVTGGLQDHVRFADDDGNWVKMSAEFTSNHTGRFRSHGEWAEVVYPSNRSLQGSVMTPYIFDDRCDFNDVADAMKRWYNTTSEYRAAAGLKGREWLMSSESGMSSEWMCNRMTLAINKCIDDWKPKERFQLIQVKDRQKVKQSGIVW